MEVIGQLRAQAALPPGESAPRYPWDRRLDGPHNRSGRRGKETNLAPPELELRPLGRPALTSHHTDCSILAVYYILWRMAS
jgi:hypothetical protein